MTYGKIVNGTGYLRPAVTDGESDAETLRRMGDRNHV